MYQGGPKVCSCTVVMQETSGQNLSPRMSYRKRDSIRRSENVYLVSLDTSLSGERRRLGTDPRNPPTQLVRGGFQVGHRLAFLPGTGNTWGLVPPENSKGPLLFISLFSGIIRTVVSSIYNHSLTSIFNLLAHHLLHYTHLTASNPGGI